MVKSMRSAVMHGGRLGWARTVATTLAVGAIGAGCQLDPGNFNAYQFYDSGNQIAIIHVSEDSPGVTTEHWAFNSSAYDSSRGVDTVPSREMGSFASFKDDACRSPPRKYLMVATTENRLECKAPVQPTVATPPDAVLGDGSYTVTQRGVEVGTVFVQGRVEHWGVMTGRFVRADGFTVRPRSSPLTWATWAAYVCTYAATTYWVVTATSGTLCP